MNVGDDIKTTLHLNRNDGTLTVHRMQDVEPILKQIKARKEEESRKFQRLRDFREIGEVPFVVLEEWIKKRGMTFREYVIDRRARKLFWSNPDHSKFKVARGKV